MRDNTPSPEERNRGVVAYSLNIKECVTTGKLTNRLFRREGDGLVVHAYDQAAADASFKPNQNEKSNQ